MNYAAHYDRLITRARDRVLDGYSERHHIVPRCMGGGDEKSNIVRLRADEHYIAHQLLVKMYPGNLSLIWAAIQMTKSPWGTRSNNKLYKWLRHKLGAALRTRKHTDASRAKMSAAASRREVTEKQLQVLRTNWIGRKHSEETKAKISAGNKGKTISEETRAKHRTHKHSEETKIKMRGRKMSDESRAKLSAAKLGFKHSEETKALLRAVGKGREFSQEHKDRLRAAALLREERKRQKLLEAV